MSRTIISHVQTDIGRRRDSNEDNFVWIPQLWEKPEMALVGAIDGVGGYEGGEVAAKLAKESIENYLRNLSFGSPPQLLKDAVINANNAIYQRRIEEPKLGRMSCVLSVAILDAEKEMMYIGHLGDSRGYIFRNGELIKVTRDHSSVGMKEDRGYLTEEEAMHHPRRNEISKMMGDFNLDAEDSGQYLDITEHSFLSNDIVLFCSDGLTDLVTRAQISEILIQDIPIETRVQLLIDKANELGGKDNITVALATYSAKQVGRKKPYKTAIEIPVDTKETNETSTHKKATRKKKTWLWLGPVLFLAGFLANWGGTKKLFLPKSANPVDTLYVRDTIRLTDSMLLHKDTLIQATDTVYSDRVRNSGIGY